MSEEYIYLYIYLYSSARNRTNAFLERLSIVSKEGVSYDRSNFGQSNLRRLFDRDRDRYL